MSPTDRRDDEDLSPVDDAERREAELLARALEGPQGALAPGEDLAVIDGPLGAARLLQAARKGGLDELRERAVWRALAPEPSQTAEAPAAPAPGPALRRTGRRAALAIVSLAAAAVVVVTLLARAPRGGERGASWPALPAPSADLLRAELAAAQPHAPLGTLEAQLKDHRRRVLASLTARYGAAP